MTSEKQIDDDTETATSSTEKTDEQEETKSKSNESDDDDTSSNASSEYEVEKILAKRRRRRGELEYYIKWVGYDDSANEWIPESSLNCPERVAEFERSEERKRNQVKKEQKPSQKRRSNSTKSHKNRLKKRRVKIIDNYDDDEDDTIKQPSSPSPQPVKSPSSISNHSDKESITYGVQKGYQVEAILGINRTKSDQLHYLVHYKSPTDFDDNMELIPSNIAKKFCEDEIIQFFETRIAWNEREHNL